MQYMAEGGDWNEAHTLHGKGHIIKAIFTLQTKSSWKRDKG